MSAFVFCFENLRELSTPETCGLGVKVVDTVELTVVLQLSNPIVNNSLFFVEQTPLSKVFVVGVQGQAKHVVFVFYFLEVETLQEHNVYTLSDHVLTYVWVLCRIYFDKRTSNDVEEHSNE